MQNYQILIHQALSYAVHPAQLDGIVRKELQKYCGDFTPFFAYIYGAIHSYRKKIISYDKEIKELKAKVQ